MKMKVVKATVVKYVAERGTRKGQAGEYVELELAKRASGFVANNTTRRFTYQVINPMLVEIFKGFISKQDGGLKDGPTDLPEEYSLIDNYFITTVMLAVPHVRTYRRDEKDANGRVLHRKGEVYKDDNGNPIVYDRIEVSAVKVEDDDTGEMAWLDSPETIVRNMISRGYYQPLNPVTDTQGNSTVPAASDAGQATAPEDNGQEPAPKQKTREELLAELAALGNEEG